MIMFANDGGFDREADVRPRPSEGSGEIPTELLQDCRDSVRRAARLTKDLGLTPVSMGSADREDRLAWAINAIESDAQGPR